MGRMTLLGVGRPAPPVGGFVALASAVVTSPGVASFTATSSGSLPAGSVAVVAFYVRDGGISDFRDSVDPSTAWTSSGSGSSGIYFLQFFKRIVPAGGFNGSTVFTATVNWTGYPAAGFIVGGFSDATSIPTSTDAVAAQSNGTSASLTVTGPSVGTSYQLAGICASTAGVSGPDAGSDASWHFDREIVEGGGSGLRTYWRKASGTGSTTLNETEGGFSVIVAGWAEAAL